MTALGRVDPVKIGIGLPSTIPDAPGRRIVEWAVAAEEAGFSTLGTIDRVVYPNHETVPTVAAAAAVTQGIGLTTAIIIAPFRGNGTLLAKQLASVDSISDGRLTVGIAVGGRPDDYAATAADFQQRGRLFDQQLVEMRAVWDQEPRGFAGAVGPPPVRPGGPPLLFGGNSAATFRRVGEQGAGWIAGGGGAQMFGGGAEQARQAWREGGRDGDPYLAALGYFSLGDDADGHAHRYLTHYYAFLGDFAEQIAASALTSPEAVQSDVAAFEEAGCDELILFPCNADVAQVGLLAEAVKR
jgi:alkanesulfonate monooxygenase SsuD/methylene tetrahydromethanopterin reductase-like flavin-dependent oxidoreductase (luciferase family)